MHSYRTIHLMADDVSLILAQRDDELPTIVHWGARVTGSDDDLAAFVDMRERPGIEEISDVPYRPSILPEHAYGWGGRPGLSAHRGGAAWASRFRVEALELDGRALAPSQVTRSGPGVITVSAQDEWAQIALVLEIDLSTAGLLRTRAIVRNTSVDPEPLQVEDVSLALPIPTYASELLDFAGRWGTEKVPQRHPVVVGVHARESRRGRTGLDATGTVAVGVPGFAADAGEVWLAHVGIGGNHEHAVERSDASLAFRGGELLLPGEIRLGPGESYESPWVYGSYGDGLDAAAHRYHRHLREISRSARRDRPVTLNVWEAVYFDHDFATLDALAVRAAELGVERYVLDDGWFRGRHDDRAGLGDWTPRSDAWPDGLLPLADRVRELGMEFGLWVEPEMINEDSDLARAHPEWILRARPELPPTFRFQQVLDLTNPDAFTHILDRLDDLITRNDVSYLKWDHNRDLIAAGHPATGAPAVHAQTLAVYRLLDELRARHPQLEIESCASGGGRVDLGILERTDRVHTSDNHDPLDRARMLRWTGLLVPPEMLGSHVASPTSTVTGRTHDLDFRCAVALIGHFGIEWDIRELSEHDRAVLARWVADYKRFRELIQTGRVVGGGDFDAASASVRGVVADDGAEALYTIVTPSASPDSASRIRLPGLDDGRRYRLSVTDPASLGPGWLVPAWMRASDGLTGPGDARAVSGSLLRRVGVDVLASLPDRAAVVHAQAVPE
jgi:alpha-galactosidase